MQITTSHNVPYESRSIAFKVKEAVQSTDPSSKVILFGSRARGDASAWDFLVLSNLNDIDALANILRRNIRIQVEMPFDFAV